VIGFLLGVTAPGGAPAISTTLAENQEIRADRGTSVFNDALDILKGAVAHRGAALSYSAATGHMCITIQSAPQSKPSDNQTMTNCFRLTDIDARDIYQTNGTTDVGVLPVGLTLSCRTGSCVTQQVSFANGSHYPPITRDWVWLYGDRDDLPSMDKAVRQLLRTTR